jgi:hypothetical protein
MPTIAWAELKTFELKQEAGPHRIVEPWIAAVGDLAEATLIRISATGTWSPLAGLPQCQPDGLAGMSYPEAGLVITDCAVGALIGRVGGSSASLKAATADPTAGETKPFPIGKCCFLRLPQNALGPIFIGFNCLPRPLNLVEIKVTFESARL